MPCLVFEKIPFFRQNRAKKAKKKKKEFKKWNAMFSFLKKFHSFDKIGLKKQKKWAAFIFLPRDETAKKKKKKIVLINQMRNWTEIL